ncbi:DNA mismatch repair endonuclease MutL [Halorussus halophilus]|uniref:DNA mismatch repair endonuclease MutL n=1 Tax=Halorussus halophilus TaxID=2650975 RepID=UPI001300E821|nr:DNA mismatch repair endonuclease MutL [Halorussus halophilus]
MSEITKLDDATIRKIAAGEVVERPASVVKELVENSVDADANRLDVTVEAGGTERIVVADDGVGMSEDAVRTAVEEHTTSKIGDIDDLESGVTTLGFRGEALHTIGAVSKTTITTKPRESGEEAGGETRATELRLEGGEVESVGPAGRPAGTTVEVTDLFYNTPARRKYLKTTATEFSHVNTVVTQYALANPDVAVSLTHDDREVFATDGRGDLQSTLLAVYGREVATSMIRVESEAREATVERASEKRAATPRAGENKASIELSGYVSNPETTRSTREYVSTYVNGRYVRSSAIREAILDAYGGQLSTERYPFAVLFLEVPGDSVDVNVHPRKMEVRFGDESAVTSAVESAVKDALLDDGLVRSSAPRGRSAPAEAQVEPEREGEGERGGDTKREDASVSEQSELESGIESRESEQSTLDDGTARAKSRTAKSGETTHVSESDETTANSSTTSSSGANRSEPGPTNASVVSEANEGLEAASGEAASESGRNETADSEVEDQTGTTTAETTDSTATASATTETTSATSAGRGDATPRKFDAPTDATTLSGETTDDPEFETLPRMQILGQLHDTYVVAETPEGLVLVDQHAADERVNYERLCEAFADDTTTQMLAEPVELELTAGEAAVFEEYRDALETLGFRGEKTDDRTVAVRTVPTVLDATLDPELLRDALGEFVSTDAGDRGETVEAVADDLLADLACYPSITGNTSLREGSVVELLAALDDCENPYACPHGRPVIIEFSESEIEDRFERDYPGHAGRRAEE